MKTPITYYGGKQQLVSTILPMIPPHKIYCEPFFGGGAVFFAKGPSYLEVINDKNDLLITFYKQCVNNFDELQRKIQTTLHSESEYKKAKRIYNNPRHCKKVDVAWAVWVVTNMSIMATPRGGWRRDNGTGGSHAAVSTDAHRIDFQHQIHDRLKHVQISCVDAIDVIKGRDTEETFFYLDPPYIGCDQKHYRGYGEDDFKRLLDVLADIKGKFILSNFMSQTLLEYILGEKWEYRVKEKKCMIPALISQPRRKKEVLVYNYQLEPNLFEL